MTEAEHLFEYVLIDNQAERTLFLLPGTGGVKEDLLFLNDQLRDTYNLVGLQGNVVEDGLRRFFKRLSPGVFDVDNVHLEVGKLARFLEWWADWHQTQIHTFAFLGYSNGANMILALLFLQPKFVKKAVLLHPMLPFVPSRQLEVSMTDVFVSHGEDDPIISEVEQKQLTDTIRKLIPDATVVTYQFGHRISPHELSEATKFLRN